MILIADIQAKSNEPRYTINYALGNYGPEPRGKIGNTRFWDDSDWPAIKASLKKTAKRSWAERRRNGVASGK